MSCATAARTGSAVPGRAPVHVTCMEPLISGAVAPPDHGHDEGWCARARRPLSLLLFLAFAGLAYSARDLTLLLVAYYLLVLLVFYVFKLEQLQRDPAMVAAAELRRVKSAVSIVSMALINTFTCRVVYVVPGRALELALAVFVLWLYLIFGCQESCDAERGHGEEQDPYEVSPDTEREHRV